MGLRQMPQSSLPVGACIAVALALCTAVGAAPPPPDLAQLECAIHAYAFEFGSASIASNAAALHDALNLGSCGAHLSGKQRAHHARILADSPPRPRGVAPWRASPPVVEVYVAVDGDDSAPGTLSQPVASFAAAQQLVRASRNGSPQTQPASVFVRGGRYYFNETLTLDATDSYTSWSAYQGENVVLSGGRLLRNLSWTPTTDNPAVFATPVDVSAAGASCGGRHARNAVVPRTGACGWTVNGTDYNGNDVQSTTASSAADCCAKCEALSACKFYTFRQDSATGGACWLKRSDAGSRPYAGHISGSPYGPPPPPPPAHDFGPPPERFNGLFVDGVRQVRARWPNGDPQQLSGLCFSQADHPVEGCSGYVQAGTGTTRQPSPAKAATVAFDVSRGSSPTHGCSQCGTYGTFQYDIYPAPEGHPVYNQPLPGVGWSNNSHFSFWGSLFDRSAGFTYRNMSSTAWANPSTGVVHMFHNGMWGGWQYRLTGRDDGNKTLSLGYGGYQEARGAYIAGNNHYYVENIREELDAPGEWFLDSAACEAGLDTVGTLYYYPNGTAPPSELVLPALDTIVAINATEDGPPATDISFSGMGFTETRATFLEQYEVPSGGDWSIHRSAAFFVQNAERVAVEACRFNQTGGNALMFSNHVIDSNVSRSEFVYTGDSAIALLGKTDRIFGIAQTYPNRNTFKDNHIHEVGVFGKQTSCYFYALAANTTIEGGACYNGPRAGINANDGFGGNTIVTGALIFNMVRETGDHGPYNSWDRQPYLTVNGVDDGFNGTTCPFCPRGTSMIKANDTITRNFIINGYNGVWTIDHDDGSQFYHDIYNFMVFGVRRAAPRMPVAAAAAAPADAAATTQGCKNYLGNSKRCDHNTIVYPGIKGRSAGARRCQTDDNGVFANQHFEGNQCVTHDGDPYTWSRCDPKNLASTVYETANNTFYAPGSSMQVTCGSQKYSLKQWEATGNDAQSTAVAAPSIDDIIAMGKAVLGGGGGQ